MTDENGMSVWANVGLTLGNAADAMVSAADKLNKTNDRLWNRLQFGTPVMRRVSVSGVYPASGTLTLNLGGPDNGTYWVVESVIIGGTDVNVTAAGSAGLYVLGAFINGSPGLGNAVDFTATLPNSAFYGGRDIVVNDGENVTLTIFGGTSAQTYVSAMTVTVYNVANGLGNDVNVAGL